MLKVNGSLILKFKSDGEDIEEEIKGSEFSLEEDRVSNFDGGRSYRALFIYFSPNHSDNEFEILFEAEYFSGGGQIKIYDYSIEGDVEIIEDNIDVEYAGSGDEEDDFEEYR